MEYQANFERLWDWKPSPQQQPAYYSTADEVWCFGGNRSGKSELVCATMAQFAQGIHPVRSLKKQPPVKIRHVGTDWSHGIETILLPKYKHLIPRKWLFGHSWSDAWSEKRRTIRFENGSTISFRAWEQEKDKHGGDDLDGIGLDEHGSEAKYQENAMRLIDRDGFIMAAMTPELGITWEEDHVTDPQEGLNVDYFFFDTEHNPHLSRNGIAKVKAAIRDPQLAEAKLHGRFVPLTGLVIPSYDKNISIIPDRPLHPNAVRASCIDLHTKTPSAALWAAWEPSKGRDGFDFIIYRTAKKYYTVNEWKQYIVNVEDGEKISLRLGDETERETGVKNVNTGTESIIAAFKKADEDCSIVLKIQQVDKPAGSFEAGVMKLREWFMPDETGAPRIKIFKSCDYGFTYINGKPAGSLPWELKRYSFKKEQKAAEEALSEKVRKVNDHLIDDMRYLVKRGPLTDKKPKSKGPIIVTEVKCG